MAKEIKPGKPAQNKKLSTQGYLDIAAVKDNILVLKNGGLRAVLLASSLNFALKAPREQEDIILRYQAFLNSLAWPIQIVMQSRKLDLGDYITKMKNMADNQNNEKIREQTLHYSEFMEKLLSVANIMDKRFYIVVPYDPVSLKQRSFFDRLFNPVKQVTLTMTDQEFEEFKTQLTERISLVNSGLESLGIRSAQLNTKQLIELFYATYNPEEAVREKLVDIDALSSRFIHPDADKKETANG
ncbi:hypothetical protein KC644_02775 [Candidatus Berkelbacteria bacterium]|nr:hypothetical protein [Candidatus Berkelbacteria bacterium]